MIKIMILLPISLLAYLIFGYFGFSSILYFVFFQWGLSITILKKPLFFTKVPSSIFLIPIILYFSGPLYENDHYRYFFEGKLFLQGFSVYDFSPQSFFSNAENLYIKNLGFPHIPSIYGPFAHILHGLLESFGGFKIAVFLNQLLYCSIILFLLKKYRENKLLILFIPFLSKEFANSIHLDFFSILFFLLSIYFIQSDKTHRGMLLLLVSLLFKVSSFIILPYLFFVIIFLKKKRSALIYIPIFIFYLLWVKSWPSVEIFMKSWEWNSGINQLLPFKDYLNIIIPVLLSIPLFINRYKKGLIKTDDFFNDLGFILFFQIILSSTINAWYLAWPISCFIIGKNNFSYWFLFAWPLCYVPWLGQNFIYYNGLLFHITGLFFGLYYFSKVFHQESLLKNQA